MSNSNFNLGWIDLDVEPQVIPWTRTEHQITDVCAYCLYNKGVHDPVHAPVCSIFKPIMCLKYVSDE